MPQISTYMEALRRLAKEPGGNRLAAAELEIREYLRADIAVLRATLERLDKAASIEADEHPRESSFWNAIRELVASRLSTLSDWAFTDWARTRKED
jgi:hypothetical protein